MKPPLRSSFVAICGLMCAAALSQAQLSSRSTSASQLQAWNWFNEKDNKEKSPAEVFAHFESHRDDFASAPASEVVSFAKAAFRIAKAAFELKKPEFEQLQIFAEEVADREAVTRVFSVARPAIKAHNDFLRFLVNRASSKWRSVLSRE